MENNLIVERQFPFKHFTTTKNCGNMKSARERGAFLLSCGLDAKKLVTAKQVHGKNVKIVSSADAGTSIDDCDGLIGCDKDIMLAIVTADCMPVLMASDDGKVKAAVHAGWKGLASGILQESVDIFVKEFKVETKNISAYIAPHIRQCCYKVSRDFEKIFNMPLKDGKMNLSQAAKNILKKEGLNKIYISGYCTCHNEDLFFSYRKDKTEKRMITVIL